MVSNPLDCVTPGRRNRAGRNPGMHCPVAVQNRIYYKVRDKLTGEVKQEGMTEGNIMASYGLNNLSERIATGGEASDLVHMLAVGTAITAEASSNTGLYNGTSSAFLSATAMAVSDLGARTVEYQATIDDASAYEIHEVGLLGTNNMADSLIARAMVTGANSIDKGTGDEVNYSYQLIMGAV